MRSTILVFLASVLISVSIFSPLVFHPATVITDNSDGLFTAWTIARVQDNIIVHAPLWSGKTFYPNTNSILFSDIFVTSAVMTLPLRLFTHEPLVSYNIAIIASGALTLFFTYLLFDECLLLAGERQKVFAFIGACVFALSTAHLAYSGHLHMLALQYVIAALWVIFRFLRTQKKWLLFFAVVSCALQVWQSFFLIYYVVFVVTALLLVQQYRTLFFKEWKAVLCACCVFFLLSLPVGSAYLQFFHTYHTVRDIREVIHFSLLFSDLTGQFWSPVTYLWCGITLIVWARNRKNPLQTLWVAIGLFAFVISLGPALHFGSETVKPILFGQVLHVPLPYLFLYYLAPGFQAFRTPSRFFPLVMLSFCAAATITCSRWRKIQSYRFPLFVLLFGLSLLSVPTIPFFTVPSIEQYPLYVHVLQQRPENILISLPMRNWADPLAAQDTQEMIYSLQYNKTLVNGQSGFFPDEWMNFQHEIQISFPSPSSFDLMKERGVQLVLIHKQYYAQLPSSFPPYVHSVYEDGNVLLLALDPGYN
ncbi:hypothetical protein C5B42_03685 [Candidatus Cerribacteria bacterium 'Amazon FNV 2010 28 9']|uniref:Glycosyltransferase RgtA/B/C/D-like domain-containing protein n=1 Tax=Candidatus Cerribacteria bacterium 'Amazon FNV 2010 28 9' TaxID=2081795 RepID=A0A317JNI9_9BACT|nr:MAG: hypothetical protein C5B42_03685 [Candidatus Cerribacteria bacterium 'Amazon FNV 2010 28 9']